ncbi:MAG: hypothetical protein K8T10_05345 [Candidatus Eremiobacteraeota bacterium]|nr:hypothetical protein [Candidatus Eremiobacteraeota bacterium]
MTGYLKGGRKPKNYNYLTFKIIISISNKGKIRLLKSLEKLLLKGVMYRPVPECQVPVEFVRIFSGKKFSNILSVWFGHITHRRKFAGLLLNLCRVKFN